MHTKKHPALAPKQVQSIPTHEEVRKVTWKDNVAVPVGLIPSMRTTIAIQNGTEKNLLVKTWGGIGDQICSEPTLRYALKGFPTCDVSAHSGIAGLLGHLKFKKLFDLEGDQPNWEKYFVFETIQPPSALVWQFFSHCLTNCVDFPSMCAFRLQLPVEDREILLSPALSEIRLQKLSHLKNRVVIHCGKHWQSKTFPKSWWDQVLNLLVASGIEPVLIGSDCDDNRGTVDVDPTGCIDLRNKTTLNEVVYLCQQAHVVLTNDSSPLHMAASRDPQCGNSGKAFIGYIATCKHPDYITHWRRPEGSELVWNWREENLGKDGIWNYLSNCPNNDEEITVENFPQLENALPDPMEVRQWVIAMLSVKK